MNKKHSNDAFIISGNIKKKKKQLITANVVLSIVLAISVLSSAFLGAVWYYMGDMQHNQITSDSSLLGIDSSVANLRSDIINIAMFGVDARNTKSTTGLSDSIIILSVNTKEKTIKTTSILRDSYVPITNYGNRKINEAYARGGPVLAINTINKNYKMNITDYVTVNFAMLADVIDIMNGIDLEITEKERKQINWLIDTEDFQSSYKTPHVTKSGMVHLNGKQAMHYARIRKIDSDAVRSQRQAKVLSLLLEKVKNTNVSKYPGILKSVLKHVETSLSYSEIIAYAPLVSGLGDIESTYVPDPAKDKNVKGGMYKGAWVYRYDIPAAADRIHDFIYGDGENSTSSMNTSSK